MAFPVQMTASPLACGELPSLAVVYASRFLTAYCSDGEGLPAGGEGAGMHGVDGEGEEEEEEEEDEGDCKLAVVKEQLTNVVDSRFQQTDGPEQGGAE